MKCDVSVKVKELGDIQGVFWKATKKSVYIKNALLNRATNTSVAMLKIERQFIISVSRLAMPRFESLKDEELALVSKMGNPKYADEASKIMAQRAKTEDPQGAEKAAGKKAARWSGNQLRTGEPLEKEPESQGGRARPAGEKKTAASKKGKKSSQEWDQFEANESLFGINPNFSMDEYAAPIDTKAADYQENLEKSTKIADEIMSEKTDDLHRLEERGFSRTSELSDEKLYSTVHDGRRWDKRDRPAPEFKGKRTEREERPEKEEKQAAVSVKCGKEAQINHELIKHKEKLNETIGGDPKVMWASLGAFLSKKKEVENKMNAVPVEAPASRPPADDGVSRPSEQAAGKHQKNEKSDGKAAGKSGLHTRDGNSDREHARAGRHGLGKSPGKVSSRKGEESSEPKPSKQVVIGSALNFKTVAEILTAITENFTSPSTSVEPRSWGAGGLIEDKIDYVKNSQIYLVPSDQRLSEISSFATYRGKK